MNRYPSPRTPRTVIGLAAIALTAVTLAVTVVWPALSATARVPGIEPGALTTASLGVSPQVVEVQCTPQG